MRVIIGSSNLDQLPSNCDRNASIICFDDEAAYTYYINLFEQFKNEHSYILDKTAAQITFEDKQILENLPILHKAQANSEHIYQSVPKSTIVKMTEYIADIERLAKDFVELPKPDRKGQSQITPDKINSIKTKTLDNMAARRAKFEKFMPQLVIEPEKERAFITTVNIICGRTATMSNAMRRRIWNIWKASTPPFLPKRRTAQI